MSSERMGAGDSRWGRLPVDICKRSGVEADPALDGAGNMSEKDWVIRCDEVVVCWNIE